MISPVIIKGNKQGIRLIIAEDADIKSIVKELEGKLHNTKHYYKNVSPISIAFEGKKLTEDEINIIIDTLRKIGLNIRIKKENKIYLPEKKEDTKVKNDGLFYIGNLKSGQTIDATKSIIIVGDVEQGACVSSEGNIIIIGELKGIANAGCKGNEDAFVYTYVSGRN